ncbi:hypothetical protein BBO99_00006362 [Phytophthora kernoviae]|uniref:Jacalin-type lectin domain-containing protein n=2 Tax=Phytophthora kernoviae TaxID=325452 RepID=A0A3R7H5J9_9STRA|nr:hypothetical protein G195_009653 [Phytophthora kernoviae 00238/432]KAG2521775.1 hypothetical protein JM16_006137 [Phytophthora kernoviae]KAG2523140.1 hypothetical protein JM18_005827 [Phytophthora kernoviae]RLN21514.1 hypothetical protein BBI17_005613 [Phytophthora kernoviae]RLN77921.1 hypothetical protein BBO99_00006362 [Phytophthora kernoviae]
MAAAVEIDTKRAYYHECIPQNDDCTLNILAKVTNTGFVVFNAATLGVFNAIYKSFKSLKTGIVCVMNLFNIAEGISRYLRFRQTMATNGTKEELLALVFQTDMFLVDLPVVVTACLGYQTPAYARFADVVITAVETMIKQFIINKELIMSSAHNFLKFLSTTVVGNVTKGLDPMSVSNITSLIDSGSTCGYQLKKVTDQVVEMVNDIREDNPEATNEDIRTIMSTSSLALNVVPTVTNNCMGELLATKTTIAAYQTRDVLRKTIGVIIDQLIETSTTDMGNTMAKQDYMVKIANMGFQGLSAVDPFGIAYMMFHFVEPICGPTEFLGEIDDGSLVDALGLTTMDDAFHGSTGTWTKEGDGVVLITFVSTDTKDVTVVVHSGGDKFAKIHVCRGKTVKWKSTVAKLQDKTMYLDRWRPGFLGLPGSGGGSLLLWVPRASHGGHLEMTVKINVS